MQTLLIVAKQPLAGRSKTRLGATLGHQQATALYRAFSADTFRLAQSVPHTRVAIAAWPPEAVPYFQALLPADTLIFGQQGESFGERLLHAFATTFAHGSERTVLIGTDSPSLPRSIIEEAFSLLQQPQHDVVLGPCTDGGWYLMGLKQPHPALFERIDWSTEKVHQQTCTRAAEANLHLIEVPAWYDIDTEADLDRLYADLKQRNELSTTLPLLEASGIGEIV